MKNIKEEDIGFIFSAVYQDSIIPLMNSLSRKENIKDYVLFAGRDVHDILTKHFNPLGLAAIILVKNKDDRRSWRLTHKENVKSEMTKSKKWDELRKELFTPEELSEDDKAADETTKQIEDKQKPRLP